MPDFWPLIRTNLPVVGLVFLFVGFVQFVAFVARRWRKS
jgi:hypothetical protein